MSIFLHIGYPKCFSTTLQRNFFSKHPEIFYGGIGIDSNIDFINEEYKRLMAHLKGSEDLEIFWDGEFHVYKMKESVVVVQ